MTLAPSVLPFAMAWLRNDLRCFDNAAIYQAQQTGLPVVAIYIATPHTWDLHQMAPIKQDFLRRRLQQMQQELAEFGIPLLLIEGSDYRHCAQQLGQVCKLGAVSLFAQREYELREQHRDQAVVRALADVGVDCHFIDNQCRFAPGTVLSKTGDVYKIFTPFKKTWLGKFRELGVQCIAKPKLQSGFQLQLPQGLQAMHAGDDSSKAYPVAEAEVLNMLRSFCRERVQDYQLARDFPARPGTSGLSAYLAIGVISAQQAMARLQLEAGDSFWHEQSGAAVWLSELIWREFYKHILVAYPELIKHQPFQKDTAALVWGNNPQWFQRWCDGETGYPIVDAAMRQLNQTGWMHNRLRMIVASFLVKDLQIDWRWGEAYFMAKLIDGDFAANNGGWQWAASTGTDAAPYFRIFNPVTQSERFDPNGDFIRKFLPELAAIGNKHIHWPHPLPMSVQYAKPVVDHAKARLRTLEMFNAVKKPGTGVPDDQ
ncbi:deoxyribodipyrimidine photo-lyase [Rheinheimera riviphila]|uniref:Deoxyribodipyrimidine photo-lyase n=1 Tax=Rheinheimera riviphila TaxID=1834037 RepID=A0A437R343_9GAMM|nr:deoxyribodipyrimidine photo-lyase [Rheinheimera riviphila]RVU41184.1 deoxyribodipyrimidine photo-lyase [Rheinheimera riviphila]